MKSERLKAEDGVKVNKWAMLGVEGRNGKRVNKECNQCFIDTKHMFDKIMLLKLIFVFIDYHIWNLFG